MILEIIPFDLTVCQLTSVSGVDFSTPFYFIGKTDKEYSLVCRTEDVPDNTLQREDGWKAVRIQGTLEFSLIGILAELSKILADHKIGIFVVSTFDTDYILVKAHQFSDALYALKTAGYVVEKIPE